MLPASHPSALRCGSRPRQPEAPSPQQRDAVPHGPGPQAAAVPFGRQACPGRATRVGAGGRARAADHRPQRLRADDTPAFMWEHAAGARAPRGGP